MNEIKIIRSSRWSHTKKGSRTWRPTWEAWQTELVFGARWNDSCELGERVSWPLCPRCCCQRGFVEQATKEWVTGRHKGYRTVQWFEAIELDVSFWDGRSFGEQLEGGSNLTERLLSTINWQSEIRFLIRFWWDKNIIMMHETNDVSFSSGSNLKQWTIIDNNQRSTILWKNVSERIPESMIIWEEAPELKYHWLFWGWFSIMVLATELKYHWLF